MAEATKECPFCAETIKAKAIYCRFCQHYLDGRPQGAAAGDDVGGDKISAGDLSDVKGTAVGRGAKAINVGDVEGTFIQADGPVILGKELRDEQYEIALNWEDRGRPRMRGFDLSKRDLSGLNLANADLQKANLKEAFLYRIDLTKADLFMANLDYAELSDANLHRTSLAGARLVEANLHSARLNWANLYCSNMCNAQLTGSDLGDANLFGAILTGAKFSGARYNDRTMWPEGFDPKFVGAIRVDDEGNPVENAEG